MSEILGAYKLKVEAVIVETLSPADIETATDAYLRYGYMSHYGNLSPIPLAPPTIAGPRIKVAISRALTADAATRLGGSVGKRRAPENLGYGLGDDTMYLSRVEIEALAVGVAVDDLLNATPGTRLFLSFEVAPPAPIAPVVAVIEKLIGKRVACAYFQRLTRISLSN